MSFAIGATPIWPVPPDWANGVRETLDWLTGYMPARSPFSAQPPPQEV